MKYRISSSPIFEVGLKRLCKKYKSMPDDFGRLLKTLRENPLEGTLVGKNVRKVRMAIKSKGKGKSGGARVITFIVAIDNSNSELRLLTIYDKGDRESISDKEILDIINACY